MRLLKFLKASRIAKSRKDVPSSHMKKLAPPRLIPFTDHVADTRPTFKWHPVPGATHYRLSLKNLHTGEAQFFYDIRGREFRPQADLPSGEYQWYVKAISTDGEVVSRGQFVEIVDRDRVRKRLEAIAFEKSSRKSEHEAFIAFGKELTYESNKKLKLEEIVNKSTKLRSFPLNIIINLGHNCNIDCIMCPSGKKIDDRRIPEYLLTDVSNYLPFLDNLLLSGGEPLLYKKELDRLIGKSEDYPNVKVGLFTNGQLLDESWVKRICSGKFSNLHISVDAANADTYHSIRHKASFGKIVEVLESVAACNKGQLWVTLNFVVMRRNYREMLDFVEMANKYNVEEITFNVMRHKAIPEMRAESILYDINTCIELLNICDEVDRRASSYGINIVDKVRPFLFNTYPELIEDSKQYAYLPEYIFDRGIESNLDERIMSLMLQKKPNIDTETINPNIGVSRSQLAKSNFFCSVPFNNLNVDVEDSLICCSSMRSFYFIPYERTWRYLHDIWNSQQYQEARKLLLQGRVEELCHPVCAFYHKGGYKQERDKYLWV